jgi:NADH-quinone oxidoreductase subunit A
MPGQTQLLWPLAVYLAAALGIVVATLVISYVLGERHSERATGDPFESGVLPVGYARFRLPAKFYLMAMFFVIFDLEAVFIFAWAIAVEQVGWAGYAEVCIFIAILIAALAYLWRIGALEWGPKGHRKMLPPGHWTQPQELHRAG